MNWKAILHRLRGLPRTLAECERSLQTLGTLRDVGWQKSVRAGRALGPDGQSLPWWTYPAIEWIRARVRKTDRVFEYGCGSSTLWLAAHAASVVSVEHDRVWFERIGKLLPTNAAIQFRPAGAEEADDVAAPYARAILDQAEPLDIVVIDGMERNACARLAVEKLADDGLIVFDNSHRTKYREGMAALSRSGLWRVDFDGLVPASGVRSVTSVFGRKLGRWLDSAIPLVDVGT